jgi:hypothetical protein
MNERNKENDEADAKTTRARADLRYLARTSPPIPDAAMQEAHAQVASYALIRVEAEHPVESELLSGTLQQELAVAMFGRSTRLDVGLPGAIRHNQSDLRVIAE